MKVLALAVVGILGLVALRGSARAEDRNGADRFERFRRTMLALIAVLRERVGSDAAAQSSVDQLDRAVRTMEQPRFLPPVGPPPPAMPTVAEADPRVLDLQRRLHDDLIWIVPRLDAVGLDGFLATATEPYRTWALEVRRARTGQLSVSGESTSAAGRTIGLAAKVIS